MSRCSCRLRKAEKMPSSSAATAVESLRWPTAFLGSGICLLFISYRHKHSFSTYSYKINVCLINLGSWAEKDVNPALFSRELMAKASSFVEDEEVLFLDYL